MARNKQKEQAKVAESLLPNSLQLDKLQAPKNNGRGVSCVRSIVASLASNKIDDAKAIVNNEWDKIANYPDICQWLKDYGLADKNNYVNN